MTTQLRETLICPQHDICTIYNAYARETARTGETRNIIRRLGKTYHCSALDYFLTSASKDHITKKTLTSSGSREDEVSCGCMNIRLLNHLFSGVQ